MNFKSLRFYVMAFVVCGLVLPFVDMHAASRKKNLSALVHHDPGCTSPSGSTSSLVPAVLGSDGSLVLNKEVIDKLNPFKDYRGVDGSFVFDKEVIEQLKWLQGYLRQSFSEDGYDRPPLSRAMFCPTICAMPWLPFLAIACIHPKGSDIIPYVAVAMVISFCYYFMFLKERHIPTFNLVLASFCGLSPLGLAIYGEEDRTCHGIGVQFVNLLRDRKLQGCLEKLPQNLVLIIQQALPLSQKYCERNGKAVRKLLNEVGYELLKEIDKLLAQCELGFE